MTDPDWVHRAIFGASQESGSTATDWLDRHLLVTVGSGLAGVDFAAGDIGAVWGASLTDGRRVVVKALRAGADLTRVATVVRCQRSLAARGFPCAEVLDGPSVTDGVVAVVEQRFDADSTGDPHRPAGRAAMAAGLAWLIELLGDVDGTTLLPAAPAWTRWDAGTADTGGLWPQPHDPIFDFTVAAVEYAWLDDRARRAALVLNQSGGRSVVGHSDWVWQNVSVSGGELTAGYDWDSLAWVDEAAVVGLCAGAFTQGSPHPPDAPVHDEVVGFLDDYQAARGSRFSGDEQRRADAAAIWIRCYNARCQLDNLVRRAMLPPAGSFIDQLTADRPPQPAP